MTWAQRIKTARKNGKFTPKDKDLVGAWDKCAISENKKIVISSYGRPLNEEYWQLGIDFMNAVYNDNFNKAETLLRRIKKL